MGLGGWAAVLPVAVAADAAAADVDVAVAVARGLCNRIHGSRCICSMDWAWDTPMAFWSGSALSQQGGPEARDERPLNG